MIKRDNDDDDNDDVAHDTAFDASSMIPKDTPREVPHTNSKNKTKCFLLAITFLIVGLVVGLLVGFVFPTGADDSTTQADPFFHRKFNNTMYANASLYSGRYVWTWSSTDDDGANPALHMNDDDAANLTFSVAFSGWGDIYAALSESEIVYPILQGEKYISVGGGTENGYWTASVLSRLDDAIGKGALDAYVGMVYDIEEGDSGLLSMFRHSFAIAKSKGFKVIVTYSHSAPYGIEDASLLMQGFFLETNIDALSPQLYTTGNESLNDYSELYNVAWSDYYNATPAIIPSLVNGGSYFMDAQEFFETEYGIPISGYVQWTQN